MSATVLHTPKTVQSRYPTSYNIRTQDRVDMSIVLTSMMGWWVFRRGRWYSGEHPDPPTPDQYPEEDEEEHGAGSQEEHDPPDGAVGGAHQQ